LRSAFEVDHYDIGNIAWPDASADTELEPLQEASLPPLVLQPFHRYARPVLLRGTAAATLADNQLTDYASLGIQQDNIGEYITNTEEDLSHVSKNKTKTLSRVRRIKGQVEAIERALEGEGECEEVLQLVASCRGALNGLMAELIEGHLRFHVLDPSQKTRPAQLVAADDLIAVVKRYFN
jgi:FrmR/RcnR family transcriptional regulator, repressor of frmRAB operon